MMSGIDVTSLTKLSDDAKGYFEDLEDQAILLKNEFELIKKCCVGVDLNFLYNDYEKELDQLDKVSAKAEGYYLTTKEVVNGYKGQEHSIAGDIGLYL